VLLTHDLKTMPRHFAERTASRSSAGVVIVPQSAGIGPAVEYVLAIWATTGEEEWVDRLFVVPSS